MHERWRYDVLADVNLVFHATTHAQGPIEAIGGLGVCLPDNAVPEAASASSEAAMHAPPGVKRFAELHLWPMEDFNGIAAGVRELEHFEHVALDRFLR